MQGPLFVAACAATLRDMSDSDSVPFPPGIEPMTVAEAIRAITIDAAWQLRLDDKLGSLQAGKLADIVVLDANPFEVDPAELAEIKVLKTMMDGEFTYEAKN